MHVLERFGWLAHCTPGFRAFMLANLRELRFSAGETMTHAGDDEGGAFGLIEGQSAFVTTIGNAAVGISQTGFAGAWWGQGPLLGMPRVGIASARTACRVGFVPLPLLKTHLAGEPLHWRDIALGYTDHVHIMAGAHADCLIPDHRRRLAATLLRFGGHRHRRFPIEAQASFLCTRDELAGALGLARNTITRQFARLEADGLATARYGRVTLIDLGRLKALADGG